MVPNKSLSGEGGFQMKGLFMFWTDCFCLSSIKTPALQKQGPRQ